MSLGENWNTQSKVRKTTSLDLSSMLMIDVLKHADIELKSEVLRLIYLQEGQVR